MSRSQKLDRIAMLLSGVCLVHCLVVPVALTLVPIFSLSALAEDLLFHQLMLWIIVPTSLIALTVGCKKHRRWPIAITGLLGILVLFIVSILGHDFLSVTQEKISTTFGGLILAFSHYLNYRACQEITCSSESCQQEHHH